MSLKEEFLALLESDVEFRYAVAGKLGLLELLKRLDSIEAELKALLESFNKLHEEQVKLREDFNRHEEEGARRFKAFEEEMRRLREDFNKHEAESAKRFLAVEEQLAKLREDFNKHEEEDAKRFQAVEEHLKRHDEELKALREDFNKLHSEQVKLREDFNRHGVEEAKRFKSFEDEMRKLREDLKSMSKELSDVKTRLTRVERTLEELTLDVEEEARSFIKHRAREKLGVDVEVKQLVLPDLELNIYAAAGDLCIAGEATVRAGVGVLRRLEEKLRVLRSRYPERLRPRVVPLIYTSLATPDLVEEAKARGVWVLKATGDITPPPHPWRA